MQSMLIQQRLHECVRHRRLWRAHAAPAGSPMLNQIYTSMTAVAHRSFCKVWFLSMTRRVGPYAFTSVIVIVVRHGQISITVIE